MAFLPTNQINLISLFELQTVIDQEKSRGHHVVHVVWNAIAVTTYQFLKITPAQKNSSLGPQKAKTTPKLSQNQISELKET